MAKGEYFWGIVTIADLWKELGWNSIIFLAAIMGIDGIYTKPPRWTGPGVFAKSGM